MLFNRKLYHRRCHFLTDGESYLSRPRWVVIKLSDGLIRNKQWWTTRALSLCLIFRHLCCLTLPFIYHCYSIQTLNTLSNRIPRKVPPVKCTTRKACILYIRISIRFLNSLPSGNRNISVVDACDISRRHQVLVARKFFKRV